MAATYHSAPATSGANRSCGEQVSDADQENLKGKCSATHIIGARHTREDAQKGGTEHAILMVGQGKVSEECYPRAIGMV